MKIGVFSSAINPIRDSLANLELDIARGKEMSIEEREVFRNHCTRLTIAGLYICGITTSIGAIVP